MRQCFIPRDGYVLCSTDFNGHELVTWAQVMIWTCKESRLADVLNAGRDPHTELGARMTGMPLEEAYAKKKDPDFKAQVRNPAKAGNFGFPGGMGPKKFRVTARRQGIELSLDECYKLRDAWLDAWGGQKYFDFIERMMRLERSPEGEELRDDEGRTIRKVPRIEHFVSKRLRGKVDYCAACNTYFQGLAADSAKAAGLALSREMYTDRKSPLFGSRIVNFIHDEFLTEIPIDRMHEAAHRQAELQCAAAQSFVPDVKVSCEPALMMRWEKKAEAVYHDGRLVPWKEAA